MLRIFFFDLLKKSFRQACYVSSLIFATFFAFVHEILTHLAALILFRLFYMCLITAFISVSIRAMLWIQNCYSFAKNSELIFVLLLNVLSLLFDDHTRSTTAMETAQVVMEMAFRFKLLLAGNVKLKVLAVIKFAKTIFGPL